MDGILFIKCKQTKQKRPCVLCHNMGSTIPRSDTLCHRLSMYTDKFNFNSFKILNREVNMNGVKFTSYECTVIGDLVYPASYKN